MRQKIFQKLAHIITTKSGYFILFSVFCTLFALGASSRLKMKTEFSDMMPKDIPQIEEFNHIMDEYTSISAIKP